MVAPGTYVRRAVHHPGIRQIIYAQFRLEWWSADGQAWLPYQKFTLHGSLGRYDNRWLAFDGHQFKALNGYYLRARIRYTWRRRNGRLLGWKLGAFKPGDYWLNQRSFPPFIQEADMYAYEGWAYYEPPQN